MVYNNEEVRSLDVSMGFDMHHGNTSIVNREVALPGGQKPLSQAPEEFCSTSNTAYVLILELFFVRIGDPFGPAIRD